MTCCKGRIEKIDNRGISEPAGCPLIKDPRPNLDLSRVENIAWQSKLENISLTIIPDIYSL